MLSSSATRGGRGPWWRRGRLLPWAGLATSLLATALATLVVSVSVRSSDESRFENVVSVTRERLMGRMRNYSALLIGTGRLFAVGQDQMSSETFSAFVGGLRLQERYPGVRGLGFAVRLDANAPHPLAVRLYDEATGGLPAWPATGAQVTDPVTYFEPLDASTSASIGYDMGSDPDRREAMDRAVQTGELALSGPLLRQAELRPGERPGFNLYFPVFLGQEIPETPEAREAALLGFLFAPFRAGDLFVGGLTGEEVDFEVYDGTEPSVDRLLLTTRSTAIDPSSDFSAVQQVELYGRVWTLHFHSRPAFERSTLGRTIPWLVGAGLVFSALIFLMLRRQVKAQRRAEDHLHTLRLVVDSGVVAMVVVDRRTQQIVEANEAFLRMAGCTFRDLELGRYVLSDFISDGADGEGLTDRLSPTEQPLRRADGTLVPILVGRAPLPGEPYHEVLVGADLSERKAFEMALRESQERYELATRATRDVVWDLDLETEQMQWARSLRVIFGIDAAPAGTLRDALEEIHPEDRARVQTSLREAAADPKAVRWEAGYRFRRGDGSYADVMSQAFLVRDRDGRPLRMVGAMSDVSDRKRVESERAELLREAREGVRIRDEFLSVASHELKTPLTPLSLRLEKIGSIARREEQENPQLSEELRLQVRECRRQVFKLTDLIANLLDVSRIDAGQLRTHASAVELASVVRVASERRRPEARRAGSQLLLSLESPIWGSWDPGRLDQIVDNLVANAIKYGAGEQIEVTLEVQRPGWVVLKVRDYGIGIAPEQQARIFERFARAVSDRHYGGLGLGLYVTRSMVEALGGTIRVESRPDEGSTFTVELPHHRVEPEVAGEGHAPHPVQ